MLNNLKEYYNTNRYHKARHNSIGGIKETNEGQQSKFNEYSKGIGLRLTESMRKHIKDKNFKPLEISFDLANDKMVKSFDSKSINREQGYTAKENIP